MGELADSQAIERLEAATAAHLRGQGPLARAGYRQSLSLSLHCGAAWQRLAMLAQQSSRLDLSERFLRQGVAILPRSPSLRLGYANLLAMRGDSANAERAFRQVLSLEPDQPEALNNHANTLKSMWRMGQAEAQYRRAASLRPNAHSIHDNLAQTLRTAARPADAIAAAIRACALRPAADQPRFHLSLALADLGDDESALLLVRDLVRRNPRNAGAVCHLGSLLQGVGEIDEACTWLRRALAMVPEMGPARHLLAILGEGVPEKAPPDYVVSLFNEYAARFDDHLTGTLAYRAPIALRQAIDGLCGPDFRFRRAMDLGCGTGLVGITFRDRVDVLEGCDLSPGMLAEAKKKRIYDHLEVGDLVEVLSAASSRYDLILAGDVLVYMGVLAGVFRVVVEKAEPGAVFGFTLEGLDDVRREDCATLESADLPGYEIGAGGRYRHRRRYVCEEAVAAGFRVGVLTDTSMRNQAGVDVPGLLVLLVAQ